MTVGKDGETAVAFQNASVRFERKDGDPVGLRNITASVQRGETVTIVGPSGSGKSTLLSLCNLLVTAREGEVSVLGREVRTWPPTELRRRVAMVFQALVMLPGTVQDNLLLGPRLHGGSTPELTSWLETLGLEPALLNQNARDLSGGQQQRVNLLRSVLNEPDILLLDEVTSALDEDATRRVERLIARLKQERQCTVLWVTHNLQQARRVGDQTWLIVGGQLVESAATAEFFEHPASAEAQQFVRRAEAGGEPS